MSEKLEEYIRKNKKAFEMEFPSAQLWESIASRLDKKTVKLRLRLSLAASLVLIAGFAAVFMPLNKEKNESTADVRNEYVQKETRFAGLIEEKKDSLRVLAKDNPALYIRFSADLEDLNKDYYRLKKELQNSSNQRFVTKAIVKNLELQLQVISQQLAIINQVNESKRTNQI